MFCLVNVLFKCTKTAFIRNVVTVTVRLRVIRVQMKSRELPQEFIDGGWFWRYFVICVPEGCWHGRGFGLLCQNVSFGILVCFPLPVCIYNQMLGGLSSLNPEVYGCLLLEDSCAAWHVVSFTATVLHGILKTTARCSVLVWCRAKWIAGRYGWQFFFFFPILLKKKKSKLQVKKLQECMWMGYRTVWAMYAGWNLWSLSA